MNATTPALPEQRQLVAGRWASPSGAPAAQLADPSSGDLLGSSTASEAGDVEAALAAADAAFVDGGLEAIGTDARADLLDRIAGRLSGVAEQVASLDSLQTGVPIGQTRLLTMIVSGAFALAAGQLRSGVLDASWRREDGADVHVDRRARGPAACVLPWNAPSPMASHKIASALAAGAPTLCKPSETAPSGVQLVAETIADELASANLHPGTFQLLHGGPDVGAGIVGDPRIRAVSFTGGLAGGRAIAAACAPNLTATQLELGGNNPLVLLPGADLQTAARATVDLLTTLNGQWCRALGRLIVPAEMAGDLVEAVLAELASFRAGSPFDEATDLGPMVTAAHRDLLVGRVDELIARGGIAYSATDLPEKGTFLAPTLVTGVASRHAREEIFGPVATVHPYEEVDEAIGLANDTPYGLEGYVLGPDEKQAMSVASAVRAGEVKVNGSSVMSLHLMSPRPAWGLSGLGDEGTAETLLFFTNPRVTGVENAGALHRRGVTP